MSYFDDLEKKIYTAARFLPKNIIEGYKNVFYIELSKIDTVKKYHHQCKNCNRISENCIKIIFYDTIYICEECTKEAKNRIENILKRI